MSFPARPAHSRSLIQVAGVFFFALLIFFHVALAQAAQEDPCITGFARPDTSAVANGFVERRIGGLPEALIQPPIQQWLTQQKWQAGYTLWLESRRCRSGFGTGADSAVCSRNDRLPEEDICQGARDGYEFLVMHRYLLQTMRALWPQARDPFVGWERFPRAEDYPLPLQPRFYAWPNGVLDTVPDLGSRTGNTGHGDAAAPGTTAERREWLLARWKNEGQLGQWLQCGTTQKGLSRDGLYPALMTNAVPVGDKPGPVHAMDLYLFWKTHGWIDQVWEDYRNALGKTPDDPQLQAALIQQCRIHQFWTRQAAAAVRTRPAGDGPLYRNGDLDADQAGKMARLLGEVVDMQPGPAGKIFMKIDLRLVGVNPIWVSSYAPLTEGAVRPGAAYEFIGTIELADTLDSSGQLRKFLQSPTLLLVKSLQSPK